MGTGRKRLVRVRNERRIRWCLRQEEREHNKAQVTLPNAADVRLTRPYPGFVTLLAGGVTLGELWGLAAGPVAGSGGSMHRKRGSRSKAVQDLRE